MSVPTEKKVDRLSTSVVPPKKRRKPSSADHTSSSHQGSPLVTPGDKHIQQPALEQATAAAAVSQSTPPFAPAVMALPPPLLSPYPYTQLAPAMPYYHPLYQGGPFYLPVGSSPPLAPQCRPRSGNTPRILPKTTAITPSVEGQSQSYFGSPPLHPNNPEYGYHPLNLPIAAAAFGPGEVHKRTTADEREHARKMSHSAIERRRRERINDKIVQLRQLIPSCSNQEHLHKMTVLQSAIDYIGYLKDVISDLDNEQVQAEKKTGKMKHGLDAATAPAMPGDDDDDVVVDVDQEGAVITDDQKGIKPIDLIQAGMVSSVVTPVPAIQNQEWASSASSPFPPPLLSKTPDSPRLPARSCSPGTSPDWSEDGCLSPTLPAASLTPQPGSQQKHMSVENLLC